MADKKDVPFSLSEGDLSPCGIFIDREGDWYHRGSRMHRSDIVGLLCQHMKRDVSTGLYLIQLGKQRCYLEVEDAPLVISRVTQQQEGDETGGEHLLLSIKHLEPPEPLDPTSLWVGKENVLYCEVLEDRFPARFSRPAYYQLAEFIHEDRCLSKFYLLFEEKRYYIDYREQHPSDN